MGNRRSRLSQRTITTDSIDDRLHNFEQHQHPHVRDLCSQSNCSNFEDLANNMSFCTQCYTNYIRLLSEYPSDTAILDTSSANNFNSHNSVEAPAGVSHGDDDFEIILPVPKISEIRSPNYLTSTSSQHNVATKPSKPKYGANALSTEPDSKGVIVKTMREAMLCPICLELLEDAKTLPCQHMVCKDCLIQWVASKGQLKCPTCNTRQRSPAGGVEGLPSNFTVNSLVAEMKKLDMVQMEEAEARALKIQEELFDVGVESQSISTMISGASPLDGLNLHSSTEDEVQQDTPVAVMSFLQNLGESLKYPEGSIVRMKVQLCNAGGHPIPATNSDIVEVTLCDPTGGEVHLNIDKCDGDFSVTFVAQDVGTHRVYAFLAGEAIVGSPAVIDIYRR